MNNSASLSKVLIIKGTNVSPLVSISRNTTEIRISEVINFTAEVVDDNNSGLKYEWSYKKGTGVNDETSALSWTAPSQPGFYFVNLKVTDNDGAVSEDSVLITVKAAIGSEPAGTGTFSGVVKDSSGNIVTGATVKIKLLSKSVLTDNEGKFVITDLPRVFVNVEASKTGTGFNSVVLEIPSAGDLTGQIIILENQTNNEVNAIKIIANKGINITNKRLIEIGFESTSYPVSLMISENSDFSGANWENFLNPGVFPLSEADGEKKIYLKFKYSDGTVTSSQMTSLTLDTTPPIQPVLTYTGEPVVNKLNVEVNLSVTNADYYFLSTNLLFTTGTWETLVSKASIQLIPGDGLKKIYVKYRDEAGNETPVVFTSVTLKGESSLVFATKTDKIRIGENFDFNVFHVDSTETSVAVTPVFEIIPVTGGGAGTVDIDGIVTGTAAGKIILSAVYSEITATTEILVTNNSPLITLTNLSGGETLKGITEIKWNATDADAGDVLKVSLYLSSDSGGSFEVLLSENLDGAAGTYFFNTNSYTDKSTYRIKGTVTDGYTDYSVEMSGDFTIDNSAPNNPPVVSFTSPVDNDKLLSAVHSVSFTVTDVENDQLQISISLSKAGGEYTILASELTNVTSYDFDSSKIVNGDDYKFKLTVTDGKNTVNEESVIFTIDNKPPVIYINEVASVEANDWVEILVIDDGSPGKRICKNRNRRYIRITDGENI